MGYSRHKPRSTTTCEQIQTQVDLTQLPVKNTEQVPLLK